jgi:hypothetical protein
MSILHYVFLINRNIFIKYYVNINRWKDPSFEASASFITPLGSI